MLIVIALVEAVEPQDMYVVILAGNSVGLDHVNRTMRRQYRRAIAEAVDINIAAEAILDTVTTTPGCNCEIPTWTALLEMCDASRLLEYQHVAAEEYLRKHGQQPLTASQARVLHIHPQMTSFLATFCSCGCLKEGKIPCSGCSRAHYFSQACKIRCASVMVSPGLC